MAKSTFQGVIRTYGGQDKSSGVTPAPVMCAEVINFLASTTTATTVPTLTVVAVVVEAKKFITSAHITGAGVTPELLSWPP